MEKEIWLDMDGTFADLYSVKDWLEQLMVESTAPYSDAKPLVNMSLLARLLNKAQAQGYKIGIISWTSKKCSPNYHTAIQKAKVGWLKKHLPSVKWDTINIVPYGSNKYQYATAKCNAILFDDEERNRTDWGGKAYDEKMLISKLLEITK